MADELYVRYHGAWVKLTDLYINGILPQYVPEIWNDVGVYSYFYIDFKQALQAFSLGMFTESITVQYLTSFISISSVEFVSTGVYKVYCDISAKPFGLTIANKVDSVLKFSAGAPVDYFSVQFFVSGIAPYLRLGYFYETAVRSQAFNFMGAAIENMEYGLLEVLTLDEIYEAPNFAAWAAANVTETVSVTLI